MRQPLLRCSLSNRIIKCSTKSVQHPSITTSNEESILESTKEPVAVNVHTKMENFFKVSNSISRGAITKNAEYHSIHIQQEEGVPLIRKKVVIPRPIQVASEKFFSQYQQKKEMRPSQSNHLYTNPARSNMSSQQRMKSQQSQSHFITNFQTIKDYSQKSDPYLKQQSQIGNILNCYSKLNALKVNQNHCWLDKAAGTIIKAPMANSRGFRQTINMIYQPTIEQKKERSQIRAVSQQSQEQRSIWERQISKQKHMFFQFHPNLKQRQNTKILNQHVQRKKNIKKLQQIFLQQASKATNHIYS